MNEKGLADSGQQSDISRQKFSEEVTHMSKVILYIATSIDGYIARENGAVDWLDLVHIEGEDYGYTAFYESLDALIMGSKTYEEVIEVLSPGVWPYAGKLSYVLSRRDLVTDNAEIVISPDGAQNVVAKLKGDGRQRIWLLGGGALTASMLALDLIDEIILSIVPVTLGKGLPLFPRQEQGEKRFKLLETKGYASGLVQIRYGLEVGAG
jgi:dihydrofolate reductase